MATKPKSKQKKPVRGRPILPEGETGSPRSVRLNDERWEKLKLLGREWLEKAIDRAKVK